jgi:hypothetical protein
MSAFFGVKFHIVVGKKKKNQKITNFSKSIPKNIKNFQICIHGSSR